VSKRKVVRTLKWVEKKILSKKASKGFFKKKRRKSMTIKVHLKEHKKQHKHVEKKIQKRGPSPYMLRACPKKRRI